MAIISNRDTGKLPLSIGTSLAFEGIMGIHDSVVVQQPYPVFRVEEIWINVRTLLRNIYGSIKKDDRKFLQYSDYQATLFDEMRFILDELHRTNPKLWVHFYYPSHRSLTTRYPNAMLKVDNSANSNALREIERWVMDGSFNIPPVTIEQINLDITTQHPNMLILTHQPVDLLGIHNAQYVGLMESHTGLVKDRHRWYTKLKGCNKEPRVPFNAVTMQIFGDTGDAIQAAPLALRSEFIRVAETRQWTQNTTVNEMVRGVNATGNKELRDLLKGLM